MAHPKHEAVRQRFGYCCGYCGVTESETGGELTVDHFRPLSAGGQDDDGNLVYACFRCNLYNGDYYEGAEPPGSVRRLLHPAVDDVAPHIQQDLDGQLIALSERGRFHIAVFHLDRPQLVAYRRRKHEIELLQQREQMLATMIERVQQMLDELRAYTKRPE